MRKANPSGSPHLAHSAAYYKPDVGGDWQAQRHRSRRRTVWYPALSMCSGAICDLGCGPGTFARMALDLGRDYCYGLDFSPRCIELASRACLEAVFYQADLRRWSSRAHWSWAVLHADTIVLLEVLEHVYEDREIIESLPSGVDVVLSVPSFWCEGHCRWFQSLGQVRARYGKLINIDVAIAEQGESGRWIFLLRGVRR